MVLIIFFIRGMTLHGMSDGLSFQLSNLLCPFFSNPFFSNAFQFQGLTHLFTPKVSKSGAVLLVFTHTASQRKDSITIMNAWLREKWTAYLAYIYRWNWKSFALGRAVRNRWPWVEDGMESSWNRLSYHPIEWKTLPLGMHFAASATKRMCVHVAVSFSNVHFGFSGRNWPIPSSGSRPAHKYFSLWDWPLVDWLLFPPTIPSVTTATAMQYWFHWLISSLPCSQPSSSFPSSVG